MTLCEWLHVLVCGGWRREPGEGEVMLSRSVAHSGDHYMGSASSGSSYCMTVLPTSSLSTIAVEGLSPCAHCLLLEVMLPATTKVKSLHSTYIFKYRHTTPHTNARIQIFSS